MHNYVDCRTNSTRRKEKCMYIFDLCNDLLQLLLFFIKYTICTLLTSSPLLFSKCSIHDVNGCKLLIFSKDRFFPGSALNFRYKEKI